MVGFKENWKGIETIEEVQVLWMILIRDHWNIVEMKKFDD